MISTKERFGLWPISTWRIGIKLTIAFLVLALVPLIMITFFVNSVSRVALLNQGAVGLQSIGISTSERLDAELSEQREFIRVIGLLPDLVRFTQNPNDATLREPAQRVLTAAAEKASDYDSVAIINREGRVVLSSSAADVGTDLKFRPYFTEALKGESYISDPSVSVVSNQPAIFYSAPIKDDRGNVLGVVRSRLNLDGLWTLVEKDNGIAGTGSYSMLLDENGIRLADSSSKGNRTTIQETLLFRAIAPLPAQVEKTLIDEQRFGKTSQNGVQVVPVPEIAQHVASGDKSVFTTRSDLNNTLNQAVIASLSNKPWRYVITAPTATYTAPADSVTQFGQVAAIILGIVAIGLGILLSRTITRPLTQLTQVADRISLGELDAKVEVRSKDEIGELAESIGRMQASLQAAIERLRIRRASA